MAARETSVIATDVVRRHSAHGGDVRITILVREADPPVGRVLAGAREAAFSGWLELFQILSDVVERGEDLPGSPGAGELSSR